MDLRAIAKRRLPGGVFDYIDGGAEDERSLARSMTAFADIEFKPRCCATSPRSTRPPRCLVNRWRSHSSPPPPASPVSLTARVNSPSLEPPGARDSLHALDPLDPIDRRGRSGEPGPQLVPGLCLEGPRARRGDGAAGGAAGFDTIVPTVDLATFGRRERDVRRGFELPPKIGLDTIVDGIRHPSWTWDFYGVPSASPTSPPPIAPANATAPTRSTSPPMPTNSSTRHSVGTTSSGSDRSGTARSWSRACSPWPTPASPPISASKQSRSRTTVADNSRVPHRRSNSSRPFATRSVTRARSSATAASDGVPTS